MRNWGLAGINAASAYEAGATGRGITVAVIDTGIDFSQPDLSGNILGQSSDIIATRNQPADTTDRHGTRAAGIIASTFNGTGTIGVAYESKILSIRADTLDSCATSCKFSDLNLAASIDRAVSQGARVINLSLGGDTPDGPSFEAAVTRAAASGVVFAISAGNDNAADPAWPARYATDTRFLGALIAVGSVDQDLTLSSFSNKAGVTAAAYLVAPGGSVVTDCDTTGCWRVSGTSFAAPHVAGGLALLLQAFPTLSGQNAVDILLRTARDLGDPGTDAVFGRGIMDMARAFAPIGTTSVTSASGASFDPAGPVQPLFGAAFGEAVRVSSGLQTVGLDDYQRRYPVDMAGFVGRSGPRSLAPVAGEALASSRVTVATPEGGRLTLAARAPLPSLDPFARDGPDARSLPITARRDAGPASEAMASYRLGALSLSAWRGQKVALPGFDALSQDSYSGLVPADHAVQAAYDLGPWSLAVESGAGRQAFGSDGQVTPASAYVRTGVSYRTGPVTAAAAFGTVDERGGPLGSSLDPAQGLALPARTRFVSLRGRWASADGLWLSAEGAAGQSTGSGPILSLGEGVISSSWHVAAGTGCGLLSLACDGLSLDVSQPVRIESGNLTARLVAAPAHYGERLAFTDRTISARPSGRQINVSLSAYRSLKAAGVLQLQAVTLVNEGNRADAPVNLGVFARWKQPF